MVTPIRLNYATLIRYVGAGLLLSVMIRRAPWRRLLPKSMPSYSLLLSMDKFGCHGIDITSISVSFDSGHNRRPHAADRRIDDIWRAKLAGNNKLFDKSKFRLRRIAWAPDGRVHLDVGLTSYKEYIGTHQLPAAELSSLQAAGRTTHGEAKAHLSCALGCEAILLTKDGYVVLLRRSSKTATHAGLFNGPSGHPEPDHVVCHRPLWLVSIRPIDAL